MLRMPGATLMSRLKVYDTPAADGQRGGTPHVHLVCSEMYVVLAGSGAVEMIDANGFSCVTLGQHDALLFSPGTIHRLINPNGDLEILVIMQNSGLPERGDNVVCFSDEWLSSDDAYTEAMRVQTIEDAYQRRDRGVEGFMRLKTAFETDPAIGQTALQNFFQKAEARTAPFRAEWERIIREGALYEAQTSLSRLESLHNGGIDYLMQTQHQIIPTGEPQKLGFCGHLYRYFDPATLAPEGIRQS
jgi:mannose-6-phosphate isomerase-like protein (cupin superfamily)